VPFEVFYRPEVIDVDLPSLPRNLQRRILGAIESRPAVAPERYGLRLRRSLWGLWKLRVGDYRVVYEMTGERLIVWAIAHRSVYGEVERRARPT
jgi:mRNA interferase RelE/StbE